ncbi:P-loop containing nucleoside triphosphate hydrolase protein [Scenedesmus sp. NREL 46B-D3]|nr:P-loop containing nucleoside triphosphate hydrolase protein [Scenedesmus sp. NREL 46B-D3]
MVRRVMGKRTPTQEQVVRQLVQHRMLPAIWFIMSRRDCDLGAIATNVTLVDQREEAALEQELMQLFADNPDAVRDKLVPAFLRGVASHHAGCLPAWKSLVERCFQKGLLKLVYATGTLAAGINMPARTTVISNLARRSDDGIQLLPHNELLQMAGRAGRRGYDTLGHCVLVQGRFEGAEAAHGIIAAGPEPLRSQFATSYSLVLNLLSVYSLDEARDFLSKSFGTYLHEEGNQRLRQQAQQLMDTAAQLLQLAESQGQATITQQQKEAASAVKRLKSLLLRLRQRATAERCAAVGRMLSTAGDTAAAAAAAAARRSAESACRRCCCSTSAATPTTTPRPQSTCRPSQSRSLTGRRLHPARCATGRSRRSCCAWAPTTAPWQWQPSTSPEC